MWMKTFGPILFGAGFLLATPALAQGGIRRADDRVAPPIKRAL